MFSVSDVLKLKEETGCSLRLCMKAFEYAESHINCTPIGYLKAKTYAVKFESFDDKVIFFSKGE